MVKQIFPFIRLSQNRALLRTRQLVLGQAPVFLFFFLILLSCSKPSPVISETGDAVMPDPLSEPEILGEREAFIRDFWRYSFGDAGIPAELAEKTAASLEAGPGFVMELFSIPDEDP